jgi:hypothetical protein
MHRVANLGLSALLILGIGHGAARADTGAMAQAFADHCFSPFLTVQKAQDLISSTGARVDFYDLDPFSSATASPAMGRVVTLGTDCRCEVAFDGQHATEAADVTVAALEAEGIRTTAILPPQFVPFEGTTLLAARRLNPRRIAVVHVGTRLQKNGTETFMLVERLLPQKAEQ